MGMINKKITLRSIVTKIRNKSLQDYDDNIHDHALVIFSSLSDEEKVVFIEDVVNIFSISEFRKQYEKSPTEYKNKDNRYKEKRENFEVEIQQSLEYKNASSLIDIKNFSTKVLIIAIAIFLFTFAICVVYIENGVKLPDGIEFIKQMYNLLKH